MVVNCCFFCYSARTEEAYNHLQPQLHILGDSLSSEDHLWLPTWVLCMGQRQLAGSQGHEVVWPVSSFLSGGKGSVPLQC